MSTIPHRYDFVILFDVKDGNPNGDPDAGNLPRIDPETSEGLVTDVCLKRKLRNYVLLTRGGKPGFDIFIKEKAILNNVIEETVREAGIVIEKGEGEGESAPDAKAEPKKAGAKKGEKKAKAKGADVDAGRAAMCKRFFDVRTFGAVMSTGVNAGQVRGPVQLTFARSIDPIVAMEHSITRMAVATEEEAAKQGGDNRTMGRKNTVPYGLYRGYGFVSPALAEKTGFSPADLDVLWEAIGHMFEHDRSAARGLMSLRKLIVFEHESPLGNAPSHGLFDLVRVARRDPSRPARDFADYAIEIGAAPAGVTIEVRG